MANFDLREHYALRNVKVLGVLIVLVFVFSSNSFIHIVSSSSSTSSVEDFIGTECLKVPKTEFASTISQVVDVIKEVSSTLSDFPSLFGDFRLSNAVSDCLDLLDFSAETLSWTQSASQSPNGKHNGTGNLSSDLRTWLSASLVNQETCSDGFEGTNGVVKELVSGGLNQITSMVQELLTQVEPSFFMAHEPIKKSKRAQFPGWIKPRDRRLLEGGGAGVAASADAVVALDGSGSYTKIMDAVLSAPEYSMKRYVIYVKKGVYHENVEIKKKRWNIMMVGDGMDSTIVTGSRNFVDGWTTFRSATFAVSGRGFIARDITFENTAGPAKHQAVALRSDSDLSVFYRCQIRGYQDSLYTHTMRQFFRECRISGTVDFIFGDATAVIQNSNITARKGLPNQKNTITAQGRKDPNEPTGFSIQFCRITGEPSLGSVNGSGSTATYLGRPWKLYSRTVIMQSFISDMIKPEGWLEWNGDFALNSLFYAEFLNYGAGSGLARRVKWPGYHPFNASAQVNNYTVARFIEGNLWLPSTGVKYTAGLSG